MIHPSQLEALKYALLAFYQLFVLCAGIKVLMEDDSPAVIIPIPLKVVATTYTKVKPKVKPKARRDKLRGYRNNKALLCLLKGGANKGNSTS